MEILNGAEYRNMLLEKYKDETSGLDIKLAIIQVGNNKASDLYVGNKIKYCNNAGIEVDHYHFDEATEEEISSLIDSLNNDDEITGIILQSPTPDIDFDKMAETINPDKDVDGFTSANIYKLYMNDENILPCTVKGIIKLMEFYGIELSGSNVAVVGRGNIVGKPLTLALENRDATVTLCHSKTHDLERIVKSADIVISAVGKPNLIKADMVKDGFIGIDVGINHLDGKLVGDFDFDDVKDKASFITPVPGGVGPMTVAMIIDNLIEMKQKTLEKEKVKSLYKKHN